MSTNTGTIRPTDHRELRRAAVKRLVQVVIVMTIQAAVLFAAAGTLSWPWGWIYFGMYLVVLFANIAVLIPDHLALIAERSKVRAEAKSWDKILAGVVSLWAPLVMWIVSGLDYRFGWSSEIAVGAHIAALVVTIIGFGIVTWAMVSNDFFSGVVSIQADRGHTVASGGPYRFVRHPGYTGMILFTLATPLVLGTLWGLVPAAITAGLHVLRTALEDRTLKAELPGYAEYSARTRYRLVPGIF